MLFSSNLIALIFLWNSKAIWICSW